MRIVTSIASGSVSSKATRTPRTPRNPNTPAVDGLRWPAMGTRPERAAHAQNPMVAQANANRIAIPTAQ